MFASMWGLEDTSICLHVLQQEVDEVPKDFLSLYDDDLFRFDTNLIPEAVMLYDVCITHNFVTTNDPHLVSTSQAWAIRTYSTPIWSTTTSTTASSIQSNYAWTSCTSTWAVWSWWAFCIRACTTCVFGELLYWYVTTMWCAVAVRCVWEWQPSH